MEHGDQNEARDAADGDDPGGAAARGTNQRPRRRPGLSKESFRPKTLRADAQAGLVNAVVSVPDGLAAGALAGVNPVYGLYTSATSAIAGGLTSSSHLMMIATTSAASLAAGQAVATYPAEDRGPAVFLISLITGVFLALFAVLRVGRLVRYVSHSVMTGFLFGVSAVLVLDQLAPLVGYRPDGPNELLQFVDLVRHVGDWDLVTTVVGLVALAIMVGLMSTRFETMATVVALVVPSVAVVLLGRDVAGGARRGRERLRSAPVREAAPEVVELTRDEIVDQQRRVAGCPVGSAVAFQKPVLRGTAGTIPPNPAPALDLTPGPHECSQHAELGGIWVQVS